MRKLAIQARDFAANPPPSVVFQPAPYKIIKEQLPRGLDHSYATTENGISFDDMEIGDIVVLCHKTVAHYPGGKKPTVTESWYPAICKSVAKERLFEVRQPNGDPFIWREGRHEFAIWRVTYRWRQAVHNLLGRDFSSREELETAMESPISTAQAAE